MPSFDTVLDPDLVEVRNAVDQAGKEIGTRFDFKGSSSKVELKDKEITLYADNEFQLGQVLDILIAKLTKRNVDARFLDRDAKIEKIGGDKVKQLLVVAAASTPRPRRSCRRRSSRASSRCRRRSRATRCASPAPSATTCRRRWR